MGYILDLILLAVLFFVIAMGRRRGAIRTAVEFCGLFVAVAAAILIGNVFSDWIFSTFIRDSVIRSVQSAITEGAGQTAAVQLQKVLQALPGSVRNAADSAALSADVAAAIAKGAEDGAVWIVDQAVRPVVVAMLRVILAVLLFIVFLILIRLLARVLDLIAKLPVLRQLNGILGGVCGAIKGAAVILLALAVLRVAVPMMQSPGLLSQQNLEQSVLFGAVYENDPLAALLQPEQK